MGQPRISILIPDYNNGRTSSRNGGRDFIGDLFQSLMRTLADGGTLAIIARERTTPLGDEYDALHAYRPHELLMQVQGCGWFEPLPIEPSRPIPAAVALVARRRRLAVKSQAAPAPVPALTH